jgi:hypothetical protein
LPIGSPVVAISSTSMTALSLHPNGPPTDWLFGRTL